jgi:hypothetical protein
MPRRVVGILPRLTFSKIMNKIENTANQIIINNYEKTQCTNFNDKQKLFYLEKNDFIKDKKMISISPAGFKGFYLLGIIKYIKEHYDLSEFIFSGASAGAWISILLAYKGDTTDLFSKIMGENTVFPKDLTIREFEHKIKTNILTNFNESDFDLRRVFIGVTTVNNLKLQTSIYSNFNDLEDALDCCIASSHIPFITGGPINKYHDIISFDGGFSKYPYLNLVKSSLHITPSIWRPNVPSKRYIKKLTDYTTLLSKDKYNFMELFEMGYNDTKNNSNILDTLFYNSPNTDFIYENEKIEKNI